jgi:DNA recombination protein RmuC
MVALALVLLLVGLAVGAAAGYFSASAAGSRERGDLLADNASLTERVRSMQSEATIRTADFERQQADAEERFRLMTNEIVERAQTTLRTYTDERIEQAGKLTASELEQRKQAVENMVKPLDDQLKEVAKQMRDAEVARGKSHAELQEQVRAMNTTGDKLNGSTQELIKALRAPQTRGRWGEMQLRRVVEAAGMQAHCQDFVEQTSIRNEEGELLRPDMVVNLTDGKQVVIDSKVSLSAYLDAIEAPDEATHLDRMKAHGRHMRKHVDDLATKAYWKQFEQTPEFVVMFVPAETFLDEALKQDANLQEHAFANNVVIATPSTLVSLLRTIAYCWKQDAIASQARDVYALGKELHGRLAIMGDHFGSLGKRLGSAVDEYNKTVRSLEARVMVSARKFEAMQVATDELPTSSQIEVVPRMIQDSGLRAGASGDLLALEMDAALDQDETDRGFGIDDATGPNSGDTHLGHNDSLAG